MLLLITNEDSRCRVRDLLPLRKREEPWYLVGARLEGAYLRGADLRGANLRGADLRGANLEGAYLRGAILVDSYLEGAIFNSVRIEGAIVSSNGHEPHYAKEAQANKILFLCGMERDLEHYAWHMEAGVSCEACLLLNMVRDSSKEEGKGQQS